MVESFRIADTGEATPIGSLSPIGKMVPQNDTIAAGPSEGEAFGIDKAEVPKDKRGQAWIIFAVLGVGMLFPWNCFLTASDYFGHVFPNAHFEFVMAVVFNYPSIFMLVLSVKYGKRFTMSSRIYFALGIDLLVLIFVPIIAYLKLPEVTGLILTLGCVFLTGISTAILFGSVLGLSAFFPDRYTTAVMSGNGIAGLAAAFLRIITKLALPQNTHGLETSTTIYFALAAGVLAACLISFSFLMRLPITRYYLRHTDELLRQKNKKRKAKSGSHEAHNHRHETVAEANARVAAQIAAADTVCDDSEDEEHDTGHIHGASGEGKLTEKSSLLPGEDVEIGECGQPHPSLRVVFGKIWMSALGTMITFMITLSLFPGVTLLVQTSGDGGSLPQDWFSIILVTLFMIGDFTGRTIPRWIILFTPKTLPIPIFLRFGFVALFWLSISPDIFESDWAAYGFMLVFAVSNGYTGTLGMMFGPSPVENYEKEVAGTMMSFFLNLGIFLGAHLALVLLYLLKGTWGI